MSGFSCKNKKKGYRCSPTFVNLKSNTMKNTQCKGTVILHTVQVFDKKKPVL